jgi:farnesyl diphosphate synthase
MAEPESIANGTPSMHDAKSVFKQIYYDLKKDLLQDPAFDFTDESREWIDKVSRPSSFFP